MTISNIQTVQLKKGIKSGTRSYVPLETIALGVCTPPLSQQRAIAVKLLKSRHSSLNIPVSVFTTCVINKRHHPLLDLQSKQSFKINHHTIQSMLSMICDVSTGSRSVI